MKMLLILLAIVFITASPEAHEDRILQIDKTGNIIGLPKKFSPAKFDLSERKLRIAGRELVFPKCVQSFFEKHKNPELKLSASWYHSKDIMPYYLNFKIFDKNVNYTYTVLVNLETLELIYVEKENQEGNMIHSSKIVLEEKCQVEYKNSIKHLK